MRHFLLALASCAALLTTQVAAQDNPVVVELYTSQGCSSCPPADALLHELAEREDVIALALHVDYWDYIGWKDPFGDPVHADRQRAYAQVGQRRHIYTPEMIVNGTTDIVGAKPMKLSEAIMDHARQTPKANIDLARTGNTLTIRATAQTTGPMTVHMLRYAPKETVSIKRGENAGRTLSYANVVEGWTILQTWDGRAPLSLDVEVAGEKPIVVILQEDVVGSILAAARLR